VKQVQSRKAKFLAGIFIGVFAAWTLAPLLIMLYVSLTYSGISSGGGQRTFVGLENYYAVLKDPINDFSQSLWTSLILSSTVSLVSLLLGVPAAYALTRGKGKGIRRIGGWIFSTRFLPPVVAAVPLFVLLQPLNLVGSFAGLVLVDLLIGLPFTIWVIRSYLADVPIEMEDLATVDGLSLTKRLLYVVLPNVKLPMIAISAFTWLLIWNEYFFALLFGGAWRPLTVLIASYTTYQGVQWGAACAAGVMAGVPAVVILVVSFRLVLRGFAFGWKDV